MTMSQKDNTIKMYLENESVIKRFKAFLDPKSDGCIEWTGFKTDKGYGMFGVTQGIPVKAHRFAYAMYYGIDKLPHGTDTTQKRKVLQIKYC